MSCCPPANNVKRSIAEEQDEYDKVMRSIRTKFAPKVAEIALAVKKKVEELESIDKEMRDEAISAGYNGENGREAVQSFANSAAYGSDGATLDDISALADNIYLTATEIIANNTGETKADDKSCEATKPDNKSGEAAKHDNKSGEATKPDDGSWETTKPDVKSGEA
jgi:hypothetical protein